MENYLGILYIAINSGLKFSSWIGVGTSNNYAYLVVDDQSKDAVIIDPANPPEYDIVGPSGGHDVKYLVQSSASFEGAD